MFLSASTKGDILSTPTALPPSSLSKLVASEGQNLGVQSFCVIGADIWNIVVRIGKNRNLC